MFIRHRQDLPLVRCYRFYAYREAGLVRINDWT
jgi:hypothetical protein